MFCALSGEAPEDPVVSKVSGSIFEKRLILKYITENGRDPVNGENLTVDDLLTIKLSNKFIKPRPPAASSIPNLLQTLQNEWDAVMLETYQLKQQYHKSRQELSNALYENDAAKRVIARLLQERDEARAALASVKTTYTASAPSGGDSMDIDQAVPEGQSAQLAVAFGKLDATSNVLSSVRRKRKPAASWVVTDQVRTLAQIANVTVARATSVTALDVLGHTIAGEERELLLTGESKGKVNILDRKDGVKSIASVTAHKSGINDVLWRAGEGDELSFLTASVDKSVKCWSVEWSEGADVRIGKAKYTVRTHSGSVTALTLHPTGDYFVSASLDATWALHDVHSGQTLMRSTPVGSGYTAASIHPDGLLVGLGRTDSLVTLWDIKSQTSVGQFEGHQGAITSISFSENGYYLATCASGEPVVKIWDLRKLICFKTIELDGVAPDVGVSNVRFDYSGQFLAATCGSELRVYNVKPWEQLCSVTEHSDIITDFRFGPDAKYVVTSGSKGSVIVDGVASE
ncbi:hypothetical protein HKX48_001036 [Thoreauomyces humboldtii]|nr:hypothetical protein HKX48_001036 [Thoreauomyces humboldtii]